MERSTSQLFFFGDTFLRAF